MAEGQIEEQHSDNQGHAAKLLNIPYGPLGDFLRMLVICTLNCKMERPDTATPQPKRKQASRQFRRLSGMMPSRRRGR